MNRNDMLKMINEMLKSKPEMIANLESSEIIYEYPNNINSHISHIKLKFKDDRAFEIWMPW